MKTPTAIRDWRFVLATDLDGTFLGGSEADRAALYRAIEARRRGVKRRLARCDDAARGWWDSRRRVNGRGSGSETAWCGRFAGC